MPSAVLTVLAGVGVTAVLRKMAAAAATGREYVDVDDGDRKSPGTSADELDREQIEQLHAATLKASDSCFELKKLCATVLVPTATVVAVFTDKRLNEAVFIAGLLVIVAFWLADAVGYFYQRKLRVAMTAIWARRAARCSERYDHVPAPAQVGPVRAAFNSSMIYYLILATLVGMAFAFFKMGFIGPLQGTQK